MSRLRTRLARLERSAPAGGRSMNGTAPFWSVACGQAPLDELDPEAQQVLLSLYEPPLDQPDPIEDRLAAAAQEAPRPCGFKELPAF